MKSFILALAMLLGLVASANAGVRFRRTPLNPFRGPVVIAPRVAPSHHNDFSRDFRRDFDNDFLVERTFRDRFGRLRVGLFDQRGNLVRVIR